MSIAATVKYFSLLRNLLLLEKLVSEYSIAVVFAIIHC